ncbi:MAG: MBL fold metallo-hydrolase [Sulfolobales archaeon]
MGLGIYRVAGPDLTSVYDDNAYLILSDKCHILIDSGSGYAVDVMLRNMLYLIDDLRELKYLILTHAHHKNFGGAYYMRELLPNLTTVAHHIDSFYIRNPDKKYCQVIEDLGDPKPIPVSLEIHEEFKRLTLCGEEIRIIHIPIHTRGSIGIFLRRGGLEYGFVGGLVEDLLSRELSSEEKSYIKNRLGTMKIDVLCYSRDCVYGYDKIINLLQL